jgi:hypothetical protein
MLPPTKINLIRGALLAALVILLPGCAMVQPWERGILADRTMRPDADPLGAAHSEHIYFSREAHAGGKDVGGGGCGCN